MKFIDKLPDVGDRRIIKRFLIFPRKIKKQIRWMEIARIEQRYVYRLNGNGCCWFDENFID